MKYLTKAFLIVLLSAQVAWGTGSDFNATTSKLSVTHFAGMVTTTLTWCAWVSRDGAGELSLGRIFDKHSGAPTAPGIRFQIQSGVLRFLYDWTTTTGDWDWDLPSLTVWHHHCIAYDNSSTTNDPAVWMDGVVYTTGFNENAAPVGTPDPGTNAFNIGNDATSATTWDGRISDAAYYTRILTTNEVKQIMHKGPNSVKSGLVCYWPMGAFIGFHAGGSGGASCSGTFTANVIVNTGPPVSVPQGGFGW